MSFQLEADERVKVPFQGRVVAFEQLRQPLKVRFRSEALIEDRKGLVRDLPCHAGGSAEFPIPLEALDRVYKVAELLSVKD